MDKKGLANGLIAFIVVLFFFAIMSLFASAIWEDVNSAWQNQPNSTVSPEVKEKVDAFTSKIAWGDKLFTALFIALLIGFLITSFALPVEQKYFFLIYIFFLVALTFLAMVLSNSWVAISTNPDLVSALSTHTTTDYIMKYFPVIVLIVGLLGGLIFYTRSNNENSGGLGNDNLF